MFGLPTDVVVGAGLLVLVLLMVMIVVARMYRKAGPHEALIVYACLHRKRRHHFSDGADVQGPVTGVDVV
jgi:uncharacterized membrane protein YqiK